LRPYRLVSAILNAHIRLASAAPPFHWQLEPLKFVDTSISIAPPVLTETARRMAPCAFCSMGSQAPMPVYVRGNLGGQNLFISGHLNGRRTVDFRHDVLGHWRPTSQLWCGYLATMTHSQQVDDTVIRVRYKSLLVSCHTTIPPTGDRFNMSLDTLMAWWLWCERQHIPASVPDAKRGR
jgi:hypothetical protein